MVGAGPTSGCTIAGAESTYDIIYSTMANAALTTSSNVRYRNNFYGGPTLPVTADGTSAVKGDPRFAATLGQDTGTPESGPRSRDRGPTAPTRSSRAPAHR